MNGRQKITGIMSRDGVSGPAYWKGNPHKDALKIYLGHFGAGSEEELSVMLGDDLRWRHAETAYRHPEGKPIFDCYLGKEKTSHGQRGVFAECESVKEVDAFPWPDVRYLDFSEYRKTAERTISEGMAFFGGFWCPYFHIVADFFGMETYFIKMHENPAVVEAVTSRVLDFYCEANRLLFEDMGSLIDVFFFGNDFGTQLDLIISPGLFRKFVLPGIERLAGIASGYNIKTMLHSCGAIAKALPAIIDAGVDGVHPIQAKAAGMDAISLKREFGGDLVFMGGVDTQDLLPFGSPEEIRNEVFRLMDIFGSDYIVSPSHEALLANVSPENLLAMSQAAIHERKAI
ncbi:MAG: uroporphyrinogen decarboxylase family protein [Clostridia bacterium]